MLALLITYERKEEDNWYGGERRPTNIPNFRRPVPACLPASVSKRPLSKSTPIFCLFRWKLLFFLSFFFLSFLSFFAAAMQPIYLVRTYVCMSFLVRRVGFAMLVCLSVCLSVCLPAWVICSSSWSRCASYATNPIETIEQGRQAGRQTDRRFPFRQPGSWTGFNIMMKPQI